MAKKQKQQRQPVRKAETEKESVRLGDFLNNDVLQQLKQKQKALQEEQEKQQEKQRAEELERKKREQREREKNKTFEDLLKESNLSWKDFK